MPWNSQLLTLRYLYIIIGDFSFSLVIEDRDVLEAICTADIMLVTSQSQHFRIFSSYKWRSSFFIDYDQDNFISYIKQIDDILPLSFHKHTVDVITW